MERYTRRQVLAGFGMLATAGLLKASGLTEIADLINSPEIINPSSILVLDVFQAEEFKKRFIEKPQRVISASKIVGGLDGGNLVFRDYLKELEITNPEIIEEAVLLVVEFNFAEHGKRVVEAGLKTAQLFGHEQIRRQEKSILGDVTVEKIEFDSLENPIVWLTISSKNSDKIISESNTGIVNLSFEFGQFPVLFEINKQNSQGEIERKNPGEISISFVDGYAGDDTLKNLSELVKLARKYPQKMFVAAGGNPSPGNENKKPNIIKARKTLEENGLWTPNLMMVGIWQKKEQGGDPLALGCDLYVNSKDIEDLGFLPCTTYAVPIVSEIVSHLIDKGILDFNQIKQELLQMSDLKDKSSRRPYFLLNLEKVRTFFVYN